MRKYLFLIIPVFLALIAGSFLGYTLLRAQGEQIALVSGAATGSGFSYQGHLDDGGSPANGLYDFQFSLYDELSAGSQVGSSVNQAIAVNDGQFSTFLDFGDLFAGQALYLDIAVQLSGGAGFTPLTPRQPLTAVPYASFAMKVQPLENVVVVAKSGGDFATPEDALASITDAAADKPYLIHIGPGIYELPAGITLKPYVNIAGSGQGITILRGSGGDTAPQSIGTSATVRSLGFTVAEIRDLTVESISTADYATAIWLGSSTVGLRLTNITAAASGGTVENNGVFNLSSSPEMRFVKASAIGGVTNIGVNNYVGSSPAMSQVTATAYGGTNSYGVVNETASSPVLDNVTAKADGAASNYGMLNDNVSQPIIHESELAGATNSILSMSVSSVEVTASKLDGPLVGPAECFGSLNGTGQALDMNCQPVAAGNIVAWNEVDGPANVIWVAKSEAKYATVSAALSDIMDASADNPYLIRVAPGVYTDTIDLKSYVDIEGSGEGVTTIRGLGGNSNPSFNGNSATVRADGDITAEVRDLTIENNANIENYGYATGVWTNGAGTSLIFDGVTINVKGGFNDNAAVYNISSSLVLRHVHANAVGPSGRAVLNNLSSSPVIRDSVLMGSLKSITNLTSSSAKIANTLLADGAAPNGTNKCFNTYDAAFNPYVCP